VLDRNNEGDKNGQNAENQHRVKFTHLSETTFYYVLLGQALSDSIELK
jgi:hypothetical protein